MEIYRAEKVFLTYGQTLVNIVSFKYTRRILFSMDGDWTAVLADLRKWSKGWA